MSAATFERHASRRTPRPFLPLVSADLLKLRKRRGFVATVAAMTIGASVVTYSVLAILHAANPAHHGPGGGTVNLGHGIFVLSLLGAVAATIVGASAGASVLAAGLSNHELSTRLFLSETTVKTHVSSIFRKLGVRDRVQAVIAAFDAGVVRPGTP